MTANLIWLKGMLQDRIKVVSIKHFACLRCIRARSTEALHNVLYVLFTYLLTYLFTQTTIQLMSCATSIWSLSIFLSQEVFLGHFAALWYSVQRSMHAWRYSHDCSQRVTKRAIIVAPTLTLHQFFFSTFSCWIFRPAGVGPIFVIPRRHLFFFITAVSMLNFPFELRPLTRDPAANVRGRLTRSRCTFVAINCALWRARVSCH